MNMAGKPYRAIVSHRLDVSEYERRFTIMKTHATTAEESRAAF
jgi:hypothetical protein